MHFIEVVINTIETAKAFEQHCRCFLADTRHTFDIVDGVSSQCQKICDLFWMHTKYATNFVVANFSFAGVIPKNVVT